MSITPEEYLEKLKLGNFLDIDELEKLPKARREIFEGTGINPDIEYYLDNNGMLTCDSVPISFSSLSELLKLSYGKMSLEDIGVLGASNFSISWAIRSLDYHLEGILEEFITKLSALSPSDFLRELDNNDVFDLLKYVKDYQRAAIFGAMLQRLSEIHNSPEYNLFWEKVFAPLRYLPVVYNKVTQFYRSQMKLFPSKYKKVPTYTDFLRECARDSWAKIRTHLSLKHDELKDALALLRQVSRLLKVSLGNQAFTKSPEKFVLNSMNVLDLVMKKFNEIQKEDMETYYFLREEPNYPYWSCCEKCGIREEEEYIPEYCFGCGKLDQVKIQEAEELKEALREYGGLLKNYGGKGWIPERWRNSQRPLLDDESNKFLF